MIGSSILPIASLSFLRGPAEEIHEFLGRNLPRRASDYPFIVRECRLYLDSCRGDLELSQSLVMIATPHLQNYQGLSHRGLDLDWLESNDAVDKEAQTYLGNRERTSCHLGRFP